MTDLPANAAVLPGLEAGHRTERIVWATRYPGSLRPDLADGETHARERVTWGPPGTVLLCRTEVTYRTGWTEVARGERA